MEGYTPPPSRQCAGKSDPEGVQPTGTMEQTPSCEATMHDDMPRADTKFDEPGPDVLNEGKMPEAHTSSDN
jgi:hypothetical protein